MKPLHNMGTLCPLTTHVNKITLKEIQKLENGSFSFSFCRLQSFSLDAHLLQWYILLMPISLSPDLDDRIQQKVIRAGYRTPDEVIRKALDALDAQERQEVRQPETVKTKSAGPVWQRFQDAAQAIPEEELASLPPDGASEHDHYLYGLPKRSA
jgi:Arc/MetJ-type ribon-helix-helix transcriptional regulator